MYVCRLKVSRYTEYALITAFKKSSQPYIHRYRYYFIVENPYAERILLIPSLMA